MIVCSAFLTKMLKKGTVYAIHYSFILNENNFMVLISAADLPLQVNALDLIIKILF